MTLLDSIPSEILEHIAFHAATESFLGPPSHLVPLLTLNRRIHSQLSMSSNPLLYARIFAHKFDLQPALRRLDADTTSSTTLAVELKLRFIYLKRVRSGAGACRTLSSSRSCDSLHKLLLRMFIWLLENEENNERQLRDYAKIDGWLHDYWFTYDGASDAIRHIREGGWPVNDRNASLAMWLYWFLLRQDDSRPDDSALDVLRAFAIAAHRYSITTSAWTEFLPTSSPDLPSYVNHFDEDFQILPLPAAIPAILAFLTLTNKPQSNGPASHPSISYKSIVQAKPSCEWDCEWARCLSMSLIQFSNVLTGAFKPGSIEGAWEGQFTYTEFTAYAALLGGAPPHILQKSLVAAHQQTWKLREYHLTSPDVSGIDPECDSNVEPLPSGDPLRSYFPVGTNIKEDREGLIIVAPNRSHSVRYQRSSRTTPQNRKNRGEKKVVDVIIMGEGHSSWGQFNLIGRVRPCDGLISLSKEYIDGDRGRWLYRGYLHPKGIRPIPPYLWVLHNVIMNQKSAKTEVTLPCICVIMIWPWNRFTAPKRLRSGAERHVLAIKRPKFARPYHCEELYSFNFAVFTGTTWCEIKYKTLIWGQCVLNIRKTTTYFVLGLSERISLKI